METLADRYKLLREKKGLSNRQVAEMIDSNPTTTSRIESGLNDNFTIGLLVKLSEVLECSVEYLLLGKKSIDVDGWDRLDDKEKVFVNEYIEFSVSKKEN